MPAVVGSVCLVISFGPDVVEKSDSHVRVRVWVSFDLSNVPVDTEKSDSHARVWVSFDLSNGPVDCEKSDSHARVSTVYCSVCLFSLSVQSVLYAWHICQSYRSVVYGLDITDVWTIRQSYKSVCTVLCTVTVLTVYGSLYCGQYG